MRFCLAGGIVTGKFQRLISAWPAKPENCAADLFAGDVLLQPVFHLQSIYRFVQAFLTTLLSGFYYKAGGYKIVQYLIAKFRRENRLQNPAN
jgi:hypothetical protein